MSIDRTPHRPLSRFAVLVLGLLLALPLAVAAEAAADEGPSSSLGISDSSQRSARSTRSSSSSRSSSASSSSRSSSSSKGTATRRSGSSSHRSPSRARSTRPPSGSSGRTVIHNDRRPVYGGSRHHYPYYGYHHYPYSRYGGYVGLYWPWFYGTWYWPGYYPYYGYGYGGPVYAYSDPGEGLGALDLDVRPGKAEVWINGQFIGLCDRYDGFPSYLWLPEGTYDVVLYKEGFETLARQYTIYPGLIIDVEDSMRPGQATRPEDLVTPSTERRDERLRANRERRLEAQRTQVGSAAGTLDARAEPGLLSVRITPQDASVYLDGRFLGSAAELAGLHSGLMVDAGEHRLEVVRPGYDAEEVEFEIEAGEEVAVEVDLEES
jgi:hypothetical protein